MLKKYVAIAIAIILMLAAATYGCFRVFFTGDGAYSSQNSNTNAVGTLSSDIFSSSDAGSSGTMSASDALTSSDIISSDMSGVASNSSSALSGGLPYYPSTSGTAAVSSSQTPSLPSVASQPTQGNEGPTASVPQDTNSNSTPAPSVPADDSGEMRAVWISYIELNFTGLNVEQSKQKVQSMFANAKNLGFNTVIVHARSHGDAYYKSSYFPYSSYITGTQGVDPGWDPLAYMVETAHSLGLKIQAWINPYRVSSASDDPMTLAESNKARQWLTDADTSNDDWAIKCNGGIYYNPAIPEVRRLIIDGIREIVQNYDVDGVHFDDYFYPTTEASFDAAAYARYTSSGGTLSLADWRRAQVNTLVSGVYQAVKSIKSNMIFGISPAGNISNCYNSLYADVELWMSRTGYIDYICPQLYWGFEYPNAQFRFNNIADTWSNLEMHDGLKLYFGLAVYKSGTVDAGSDEWIRNNDIIKRQIEYSRTKNNCSGIILFSYNYVVSNDECCAKERENYTLLFK